MMKSCHLFFVIIMLCQFPQVEITLRIARELTPTVRKKYLVVDHITTLGFLLTYSVEILRYFMYKYAFRH